MSLRAGPAATRSGGDGERAGRSPIRPVFARARRDRGSGALGLLSVLALFGTLTLSACQEEAASDLVVVGTVERTEIELSAPVSERILELAVRPGEAVEPDRVLVRLDADLAEAELQAARASRDAARATYAETQRELKRVQGLRAADAASAQSFDRARRARDEARARATEAEARITQAHKRLAELTVRAPVAGVVDQLPFDVGERVPAGGVVAILLAEGPPWVRVWLPARALASVGPGTRAEVHVEGRAQPLTGSVLDIAREPEFTPHFALTERERTHLVYETRVQLDGDGPLLRPGLPAEVRIALPAPDGSAGSAP